MATRRQAQGRAVWKRKNSAVGSVVAAGSDDQKLIGYVPERVGVRFSMCDDGRALSRWSRGITEFGIFRRVIYGLITA